jgi:hypothetical protein
LFFFIICAKLVIFLWKKNKFQVWPETTIFFFLSRFDDDIISELLLLTIACNSAAIEDQTESIASVQKRRFEEPAEWGRRLKVILRGSARSRAFQKERSDCLVARTG